LSLFPFLGAELHDVSLGQPGEAGGAPFAHFDEVDLRVRLLPLMRRVIDVAGIRGSGGTLSLPGYELDEINVATGAFGGTQETDLSLKFNLVPAGGSRVPVNIEGPMVFDIPEQRLDLRELSGDVGGMSFTGALRGSRVLDAPAFSGRVKTDSFDLRALLAQWGIAYAPADGKAMTAASWSAQLASAPGRLELRELQLSLDGTTMRGTATGVTPRNSDTTAWDAQFTVDRLDLDRYMPGVPSNTGGGTSDPYASLRELVARVGLEIHQLRAFGLQFANVRATLDARNGTINVAPIRASLYDGSGRIAARMDLRSRVPAYHVDGRLEGASVQPLLSDAQQITALAGTGDLTLRLDAVASDPASLMQTARGEIAMSVRDGRLEGADFLKLLSQARAVSDQVRGRPVRAPSDPANRTKFSRLTASAIVENGVARSDDLKLEAPDLQATGAGTIDLARETIDFVVRARSDQAGNVAVPIAIEGPFSGPTYHVQTGALLRDAAEQELKKQLERRLKGLFKKP
jgi:AsmA protein